MLGNQAVCRGTSAGSFPVSRRGILERFDASSGRWEVRRFFGLGSRSRGVSHITLKKCPQRNMIKKIVCAHA